MPRQALKVDMKEEIPSSEYLYFKKREECEALSSAISSLIKEEIAAELSGFADLWEDLIAAIERLHQVLPDYIRVTSGYLVNHPESKMVHRLFSANLLFSLEKTALLIITFVVKNDDKYKQHQPHLNDLVEMIEILKNQ